VELKGTGAAWGATFGLTLRAGSGPFFPLIPWVFSFSCAFSLVSCLVARCCFGVASVGVGGRIGGPEWCLVGLAAASAGLVRLWWHVGSCGQVHSGAPMAGACIHALHVRPSPLGFGGGQVAF